MNIGVNPTVGGNKQSVEPNFFDFDKDLYGAHLKIKILQRIRDEKTFASVGELIKAMKSDEAFSRQQISEKYSLEDN